MSASSIQESTCFPEQMPAATRITDPFQQNLPDGTRQACRPAQARDAVGYPSLYDGAPADCVVYEADPRADITELSRPVAVILGGTRVA